jgi:hypothetical protein
LKGFEGNKMARPNAIKTSPFRKEIEELLLEGKPFSFIISFLKKNGQSISESTLRRYRDEFDPHQEAVEEYIEEKSIERFDTAKKDIISDLHFCDNLVEIANKVGLEVDNDNKITKLDINKLGLQAIKTKHDIIKDEPTPVTVNIHGVEFDQIMDKGLEELEDDNDEKD